MLCSVDSAMVGGGNPWQQLDKVLKVAYKIEYYVHVLPVITMRHIYDEQNTVITNA